MLSYLGNWDEFPDAPVTPPNDQVRIQVPKWNQSDTNTSLATAALMDLKSLSSGSLEVWSTTLVPPEIQKKYDLTKRYKHRITVNMEYCYGYIAWDNMFSGALYVPKESNDIQCQLYPFDVISWNQTLYAAQAKMFVQAIGSDWAGDDGWWFWSRALPIISIILPHANGPASFAPAIPRNPLCSSVPSHLFPFAVAEGAIKQSRTGVTGVGVGLQVVAISVAVLAMSVLAWPTLPLVPE